MKPSHLADIKLVGFDIDGVMTDGRVIVHDDDTETKNFHSRDGLGLRILKEAGIDIFIITGRRSRVVEIRAKDLGITEIHQKVLNKLPVFEEIIAKKGLAPHEVAFAGDDLIDLPIMRRVGLAMAPADACPEVLAAAHFVAALPGGRGAVRQMVEYILKGQGRWEEVVRHYSQ